MAAPRLRRAHDAVSPSAATAGYTLARRSLERTRNLARCATATIEGEQKKYQPSSTWYSGSVARRPMYAIVATIPPRSHRATRGVTMSPAAWNKPTYPYTAMTVTGITNRPRRKALPLPSQIDKITAATPAAPNIRAKRRRNVAGTIPRMNVATMMSGATMESNGNLNRACNVQFSGRPGALHAGRKRTMALPRLHHAHDAV
jgi:hypothetical protein